VSGEDPYLDAERDAQRWNTPTPMTLLDRPTIPTASFFVRSHYGPPATLDPHRPVVVGGLVKTPLSITVRDVKASDLVTLTAVLECAGNGRARHAPRVPGLQWELGAVAQATFTGVRLRDLLVRAGLSSEARHVHLRGADDPPSPTMPVFLRSIPIERALDPSTLVAFAMNGEDLTLEHGAPLRLVVPGWAGNHWVKWLTHVSASSEPARGFFMDEVYRLPMGGSPDRIDGGSEPAAAIPIKSLIASPEHGATTPRGRQRITGVAFAGRHAIAKVEVSLDGGASWHLATLDGSGAPGEWTVFGYEPRDACPPGEVTAIVRAIDVAGNVQPEHAAWNPGGYFWNGWHAVTWNVA